MGKYEVTQGEYLAVVGSNPSFFNGVQTNWPAGDYGTNLSRPVEQVSWNDATKALSTQVIMIVVSSLALGSALALFLYPHSITGVLASRNRDVIKRNMSALPAYSLLLGLIALLDGLRFGQPDAHFSRAVGGSRMPPLLTVSCSHRRSSTRS